MASTQKIRNKLMGKLTELFQLDQPDLDFGFYRIMQAKSAQVTSFIDKDLLKIIEDAFGQVDENRKAELQANIQKEIEAAKEYGVADPESSPKVLAAKAKYDALKEGATAEADVYDHLYRFFERYYDQGDFISRRYYARENAGKAAPFAIPYNGEEVKLYWANADQYYVKTAEYFTNFTFDLAKAKEVVDNQKSMAPLDIPASLKVHFRIVEASEGEHGNVKAAEDKKRFFILHDENPVEFNNANELIINFEYKALPGGKNDVDADTEATLKEKFGKSVNKGDMPNLAIAKKVIEAISELENAKSYFSALSLLAPTDKIENRPLLAKYINQYTARNTCDYFIHKDLAGFLKRELDFYIKNEVMHLDDIENADAPAVESYLAKLKVIRKIATKLIDFLAQLENFQKKLWLKKKFITETNYCITLDRVPEELYAEIASNETQREEWVKLFAIDEITATDGDLVEGSAPGYSVPLTVEFLKANDKLVLDTAFFSDDFKARLIASIENFDEQCNGLLIHSENFQALNLLKERYRRQVKCIYIDPPFNLGQNGDYLYRTDYKDSTWAALLFDRINQARNILSSNGIFYLRCDYNGNYLVRPLINQIFGPEGFQYELSVQRIRKNVTGQGKISLPLANDSLFMAFNSSLSELADPYLKLKETRKAYWRRIDDSAGFRNPPERTIFGKVFHPYKRDAHFKYSQKSIDTMIVDGRIALFCKNRSCDYQHLSGDWSKCPKCGSDDATPKYLVEETDTKILDTNWMDVAGYSSRTGFSTENAEALLVRALNVASFSGDLVADYFAGSGTTLAVALKSKRNWLGVEMGKQFDDYIVPRLKRECKEEDISSCFKYLRLESYEDTLNNLVFEDNPIRNQAIESNPSLKEDYMLRYLLDVETRGSQSLLNIDAFADPTAYSLVVKKPGSDEQVTRNIDLIETFNYLLGLRLEHMAATQTFTASFTRKPDPELPEDQHTKLVVDGKIQQVSDGKWWFRKLEGWVPADPMNPNNGQKEKVLIVWRKLTGNLEEDNLMLDEWFRKYRISSRESAEFDVIYVNGSNNLPNLKKDEERWKVRLIEESFHKLMWAVEGEA